MADPVPPPPTDRSPPPGTPDAAGFAPFVPRQRDADVLVLMAPPTWGSRVTVWGAWLLGGLSLLAVPAIGYLMVTGGKGLVGWLFGAVAIGTLLAVAKMMSHAAQLEGVTGLRLDADGLTVIEGQGKRAAATWLGRADIRRLETTARDVVYKGRVHARHLLLHAVLGQEARGGAGGERVYLGWLRVTDPAAARAAAAELGQRLGVDVVAVAQPAPDG